MSPFDCPVFASLSVQALAWPCPSHEPVGPWLSTPGPPFAADRLARFVVSIGRLATSAMIALNAESPISNVRLNPAGDDAFSGVEGIGMQDASLQESMGPLCDRTKENLVGTDNGIIMARHRLQRAAKALADKGTIPPGVDPEHHKVRQAALLLKHDMPFKDGAKEALKAKQGVRQTSV